MADAREAKPFGKFVGHQITEADLYHLAPHFCLKFRGRKATGKARRRREGAIQQFGKALNATTTYTRMDATHLKNSRCD